VAVQKDELLGLSPTARTRIFKNAIIPKILEPSGSILRQATVMVRDITDRMDMGIRYDHMHTII
jgi:hypothetical protein